MQQWVDAVILEEPTLLTASVLKKAMPDCREPERWAEPLAIGMSRYGLESDHDMALFLAQVGHESAGFRMLEESLNYSVEALEKLFGAHRIHPREIQLLGRKPGQKANEPALANTLYGGAWGAENLGNVEPGDGWRYRGRGVIQLTGRANYEACAADTGLDIVHHPDLLATDAAAGVESALWFWSRYVPGRDIKSTTRQVNGGYHGLDDRVERFRRALKALEG